MRVSARLAWLGIALVVGIGLAVLAATGHPLLMLWGMVVFAIVLFKWGPE